MSRDTLHWNDVDAIEEERQREEKAPFDGQLDAEQQIVLFFCLLACLLRRRMQTAEPPFDGHLDGSTLDPEIVAIFQGETYKDAVAFMPARVNGRLVISAIRDGETILRYLDTWEEVAA